MSDNNLRYIFSGRFDTDYLEELYDNDMETIMDIFESSISSITSEIGHGVHHYHNGDLDSLRRVFHKIKPLFGYVGLPSLQEYVHDMENKCSLVTSIEQITPDYERIIGIISDTVNVLTQELARMKMYSNLKVS
jgi:chemotaxis protein histidine kinase CheA